MTLPQNMITTITAAAMPFDTTGVTRGADGIARYDKLPATFIDALRGHAERTPTVEAVVEIGGERLDYATLLSRAARVAGGLRAAGVATGDRVAIRYPAGVDWVLAFWGTVLAGGIVVAVNTRFAQPEVDHVLADAQPSYDLAPATPLPEAEPYVHNATRSDDVAVLFYTSGTTGRPKGVPTTHAALLSNAETMTRCLGIDRDAGATLRTLISVPLFHVTGCNAQLLTATYLGGTSIIMPTLDVTALLAHIPAERISFIVTVPAVYALMLMHADFDDTDVSGVRWVGYGGAPIATTLVRSVMTGFPNAQVFNGFGSTEAASIITVLPHADAQEFADSVGYAAPVVDLALAPLDDSETDSENAEDTRGELLVRGPNVLSGYWNGVDTDALRDGWLHTGDIVRVDDSGRVFIVDRVKDMINRGGENISSVEVEEVLFDAPGVREVAVIGVPDDVMGEKVGAVLTAGPDGIDVDAVLAYAAGRTADYKLPQYIHVADTPIPRNAAGKVLKNRLRQEIVWGDPLR